MRHKRLAIVLADMTVGDIAGLASEIARELPGVVVFHEDGMFRRLEDVHDGFSLEGHEPPDLKLVRRDAIVLQDLYCFANDSVGRAPTNQSDVRAGRAPQFWGLDGFFDTEDFPLPLFHHCAAFDR